ncbi:MAG TPA: hypothetical protein VK107_00100 [Alloiococcus sp.]|nr:hypothetical protein [Alloiococcus sp.]
METAGILANNPFVLSDAWIDGGELTTTALSALSCKFLFFLF